MNKKINKAIKEYEKRKGIVIKNVSPLFLKGCDKNSESIYIIDGIKMCMVQCGKGKYDLIKLK